MEFTERYNLEKYILSFSSIANRKEPEDVPWKYEKICLLIVDFEQKPSVVMDNLQMFTKQGLVGEKFANFFSFDTLSIRDFFDDLYKTMMERYYLLLQK